MIQKVVNQKALQELSEELRLTAGYITAGVMPARAVALGSNRAGYEVLEEFSIILKHFGATTPSEVQEVLERPDPDYASKVQNKAVPIELQEDLAEVAIYIGGELPRRRIAAPAGKYRRSNNAFRSHQSLLENLKR